MGDTEMAGHEAGQKDRMRLEARSLAAFRGERLVLEGVSFRLEAGGALLLRGANGAGKSTLLRALAGLIPLAAGTLLWEGEDALADLSQHARRLGYLGHQDAVKPALSVAENLGLAARGGDVGVALAALNLAPLADLPARFLSAGQRRRLAIARLLLARAPLWLLDEPGNGLDDASLIALGAISDRHRAAGGMVIAATHHDLPFPSASQLFLS
jgi:heme exporter protein A